MQLQSNKFNIIVMVGSKIDLLFECVAFIQRVRCKKTDLGVDEVGI